tara:strand:- start:234 stop:371 length:138 start_codon:yes stop_codon:yes gene_type:complete
MVSTAERATRFGKEAESVSAVRGSHEVLYPCGIDAWFAAAMEVKL